MDEYALENAIDGLFIKIAEEESLIRANPLKYTSELVKKVFTYAKNR